MAGSAVLGIGALVVARVWLPAQQTRSTAHAAEAPAPGVPVVVAAQPIPYGARLEAKYLTVAKLPASAAPIGAYASVKQLLNEPGGAPVALTAFALREPLLPSRLSGPGARPTIAAEIGEGMRAYTIGVSDVYGGGGHIMPADRVDVVLTRDLGTGPDNSTVKRFVTEVILQNVRVLGMDQNADPTSSRPMPPKTATLEVDMKGAEILALGGQAGTLSLALRRTGSLGIDQVHAVGTSQLNTSIIASRGFNDAAVPLKARPPAPPKDAARRAAASGSGSTVVVTNGDASTRVEVPAERAGR